MKTLKIFSVAALCLAFAGSCAANTNNGGHVVGNPIISEGASKKMADEKDCDCSKPTQAKACHCAAPKKADAKGKPCAEGDKSCKKE